VSVEVTEQRQAIIADWAAQPRQRFIPVNIGPKTMRRAELIRRHAGRRVEAFLQGKGQMTRAINRTTSGTLENLTW